MKQAILWERLPGERVRCSLCAHRCIIFPGQSGICRVRGNRDGALHTHVYGRTVAMSYE